MRAAILVLLVAVLPATACESGAPAASPGGAAGSTAVATVGGQTITLGELDEFIKDQLLAEQLSDRSEAARHEFREEHLDVLIETRLLELEAARRNVSPEELRAELRGSAEVSDEQVEAFYTENQERLGGRTLEEMADRIRSHLEAQESRRAEQVQLAQLREATGVAVLMEAPRAEVSSEGPSLGPADAPVTIVEFSDFECPFCARASPTVKQVLKEYEGQVRVVYRHFPLESIHPNARAAAVASACADEQQKFWEYHDILFANMRQLGGDNLTKYASEAGLDMGAFEACIADGRHDAAVDRDLEEARAIGVTGTPSFFVNGRMLGGAQPFEAFKRIIDAELARAAETAS